MQNFSSKKVFIEEQNIESMIQTKNVDWVNTIFIVSYHLLLLSLLPIYFIFNTPSFGLIVTTIILSILISFSITAGYHRLYAHQAYDLNKIGEFLILAFSTLAIENSALQWSRDHRMHHRYVDTEKDPYSIKQGFWHAHMLWVLKKNYERTSDYGLVPDLVKNKAVMFQHKYYTALVILGNLAVIGLLSWIFKDLFGVMVIACLARVFLIHHMTWLINSLAHMLGSRPYSKEHSAVNNAVLALFTFGEGYHNYHHTFPSDYRNGVRWYQYDPTKIVIWCLAKIGMAKNLKKVELPLIKRKMILEDQRMVLERIRVLSQKKWKEVEKQVKKAAESLNAKLLERYALMMKYKLKKREERKEMKLKIRALKKSIQEEYKNWIRVCSRILVTKTM